MKHIILFLFASMTLAFAGCSKDDDDDDNQPSGPRERDIEYRITTPTAGATADIIYSNETGGTTILDDVSLPVTYKFKRRLAANDAINILASMDNATATSEITGTILLDNQRVQTETGRGSTAQVNLVHIVR
jgi:hypothetical protein